MTPMMKPSNDSNNKTNNNAPIMIDSKETTLNLAVKHTVESSKMAEVSKDNADEASVLLQEYHKRNCKKFRIMMSDDRG